MLSFCRAWNAIGPGTRFGAHNPLINGIGRGAECLCATLDVRPYRGPRVDQDRTSDRFPAGKHECHNLTRILTLGVFLVDWLPDHWRSSCYFATYR